MFDGGVEHHLHITPEASQQRRGRAEMHVRPVFAHSELSRRVGCSARSRCRAATVSSTAFASSASTCLQTVEGPREGFVGCGRAAFVRRFELRIDGDESAEQLLGTLGEHQQVLATRAAPVLWACERRKARDAPLRAHLAPARESRARDRAPRARIRRPPSVLVMAASATANSAESAIAPARRHDARDETGGAAREAATASSPTRAAEEHLGTQTRGVRPWP